VENYLCRSFLGVRDNFFLFFFITNLRLSRITSVKNSRVKAIKADKGFFLTGISYTDDIRKKKKKDQINGSSSLNNRKQNLIILARLRKRRRRRIIDGYYRLKLLTSLFPEVVQSGMILLRISLILMVQQNVILKTRCNTQRSSKRKYILQENPRSSFSLQKKQKGSLKKKHGLPLDHPLVSLRI